MASSTTSSNPETETPAETLQRHLDREGRLKQWITLESFNWLRDSQKRQAANEEAENRWWRKTVSGDEMKVDADDDMGNVMLGDIHNPAPIIMQPPQPQPQNPLVAMLMGAAFTAAGGAAGYYFSDKQPTPVQPEVQFDDETISVGLGKIEDYLKANQ